MNHISHQYQVSSFTICQRFIFYFFLQSSCVFLLYNVSSLYISPTEANKNLSYWSLKSHIRTSTSIVRCVTFWAKYYAPNNSCFCILDWCLTCCGTVDSRYCVLTEALFSSRDHLNILFNLPLVHFIKQGLKLPDFFIQMTPKQCMKSTTNTAAVIWKEFMYTTTNLSIQSVTDPQKLSVLSLPASVITLTPHTQRAADS